ncbi:protein kinase [Pseudomonas sp. SCA2728.1_7]|jgi:serine/threonine-protein kinase|uniref:protein kinase domain-containing protein n=1 Tax=Pseudomonas sp. SCA2728.1_7 TaxID=2825975 RepID=UPI001BB0119C|nr:protein kinase [Pseudomonas sp. SCA2728.1_7]QUE92745.1 serine/threonine-protein kinase [Pseudomonas sp. SCA2728.1_7]
MSARPIEFPKSKAYILEKDLGQGACGRTVLVFDPEINEHFVCKKYSPIYEGLKEELFSNFIREIKLLYLLNHPNIVRVFNYHLYNEKHLGYIFMEYIIGTHIDDYLKQHPESANEIFRQVIDGFSHLEERKILHRDIRPFNLMVDENGTVKIIDFGFGKQTADIAAFDKSISLNWWCEPPTDFENDTYNYGTEIYFVGKMFEKILTDNNIQQFSHPLLIKAMCNRSPTNRPTSFIGIRKELLTEKFSTIEFNTRERTVYKNFSNGLFLALSKVEKNAKYYDIDTIQSKLEDCYKKVMLEDFIPKNNLLTNCIIDGSHFYKTTNAFKVSTLKNFIDILKSCNKEKKNIIISNLQSKVDAILRYEDTPFSDDIPF